MTNAEGLVDVDIFATQLGEVLLQLAEQHPTPDEPLLRFIGETADGRITTCVRSPREYAMAVVGRTGEGNDIVQFYRQVAANLEAPAGEATVIADLKSRLKTINNR